MFDRDFELKGKHASHTKFLCNSAHVFKRYIDVYMVGAVMGVLNNRQSEKDTSTNEDANILAGVFSTERLRCEFLYRIVMLLDGKSSLTAEEKVDRAFRIDDSTPKALKDNMELFHTYVYGGIEVLYEKFVNCTTKDDYITKIYEVVAAFENALDGSSYDEMVNDILDTN